MKAQAKFVATHCRTCGDTIDYAQDGVLQDQCYKCAHRDPAGLDKLLLALGKGCARYIEQTITRHTGREVNIWDGKDGLGAVLEESVASIGVPNKRLPELLTPRLVLEQSGAIRKRPVRRLKR